MHNIPAPALICSLAPICLGAAAHAVDIKTDTTYTTKPTSTLYVTVAGVKLNIALSEDTTLTNTVRGKDGSIIQFSNASSEKAITYTYASNNDVARDTIELILGSLIIGDANDAYSTSLVFKEASASFSIGQDLILYGNSHLSTNASSTSYSTVKGHLKSLRNAASFSAQEASSAGPSLGIYLDLTQLQALTIEQSIDVNSHNIQIGKKERTELISLSLAADLVREDSAYTLFTGINSLDLWGTTISKGTTYSAADYFSSEYINENTTLTYTNDGALILTGLNPLVPEPGSATLSLLALTALTMSRRRK